MRRYETIVITDPDLSDEDRGQLFERLKELIPGQDGFLVMFDEWGTQKMAYEIRKKIRGYYVRLDYCGTGDLVAEMERLFRIDDRVLKYMTILLDKDADLESLKQANAEAEAEVEAKNAPSDTDQGESPADEASSSDEAPAESEAAEGDSQTEADPQDDTEDKNEETKGEEA
ncbi:MAG: 30S ribosomal protein S6 [Desulfobacteraceae bacterium 4572_88]|nr:MAG: 30S ribosomal protein S6 [Desulfobacteraceae bacterium 4572_88]